MKKIFLVILAGCLGSKENMSVCEQSCDNCTTGGYLDCSEVCSDFDEASEISGCTTQIDDYFYCLKINSNACFTANECSETRKEYFTCLALYCLENDDEYLCPQ